MMRQQQPLVALSQCLVVVLGVLCATVLGYQKSVFEYQGHSNVYPQNITNHAVININYWYYFFPRLFFFGCLPAVSSLGSIEGSLGVYNIR